MKYGLLIILALSTIIPSIAQGIEKIIVTGLRADEPPTLQGQTQHSIEFRINNKKDLEAKSYLIGDTKHRLERKMLIETDRLERAVLWVASNKRQFHLSELGIDTNTIQESEKVSSYRLKLGIKGNLTIDVDSLAICQPFNSKRGISTGGYKLSVTIFDSTGGKYSYAFDSDDLGRNALRFFDYVVCYGLLLDKLPAEFPGREHFAKQELITTALFALSTLECEGFYYKEFVEKNPGRTASDNRMRVGWNFAEYMGQRSEKK